MAREEGLKYVYLGNVPGHKLEHTYCSECSKIVVNRHGFNIREWNMDEKNCCVFCGNPIPIVGKIQPRYKENCFQFVS